MITIKYDVLNDLKCYLRNNFNKNTADRYYYAVQSLLKEYNFNNANEIDVKFLEKSLEDLKTKNRFSAAKNGLIHLQKLYPSLQIPSESFFKETSMNKKNRSLKAKKIIDLDTVQHKVNAIKNKKLKYAYRLAMISGLRVSELAALTKEDVTIEDNIIFVSVKNGKGGSNGIVQCMESEYLTKNLSEYLVSFNNQDNIFYSASYMKHKACQLGLECHDFRRIAAITYRNSLKKNQ